MQKSIVVTTGKDQSQVSKAIDKLVEVGLVVKNWHSHLICLLPKRGELGWLQLIAIEREQFYEIVSNSSGGDANSFFGEDISD